MKDKAIDGMINFIYDYCGGTNIDVYDISDFSDINKIALELDLFDYLDKATDFESDVESLKTTLMELGWIVKCLYLEETSVSDLDGEEYPNYHCIMKIWRKYKCL